MTIEETIVSSLLPKKEKVALQKHKNMNNIPVGTVIDLGDKDAWDDSVLIAAFNDALESHGDSPNENDDDDNTAAALADEGNVEAEVQYHETLFEKPRPETIIMQRRRRKGQRTLRAKMRL